MSFDNVLSSMLDSMRKGEEFKELVPFLEHLQRHWQDPVRLLIMGEFSVGKSTLINTLLREDVIASGAVPTTAVATYLRYSDETYIEVVLENGVVERHSIEQLTRLTSERVKDRKEERNNIHHINLFLSNPLLKDIVLIDTPGLNSSNVTHNEQAFNAYEEADDSLWIFKFGAVGRNTEMKMLQKLRDDGLHPIGVINMIDESEDDNIEAYLEYESQQLGKRVRKLIGVSSMEAKEAYEENDQELLELSGFLQLQSILENVKTDQNRKQKRFEQRFMTFFEQFRDIFNQELESKKYQNNIRKMDEILLSILKENRAYLEYMSGEEKRIQECNQEIIRNCDTLLYLKDWINKKDFAELVKAIPELEEWKEYYKQYCKIYAKLKVFKRDVDHFKTNVSKEIGHNVSVWDIFSTDKTTLKKYRLMQNELLSKEKQLNIKIQEFNNRRSIYLEKKDLIITSIEDYYRELLLKNETQFRTIVQTEQEKIVEKNLNSRALLQDSCKSVNYLEDLRQQIVQIALIHNTYKNEIILQELPHIEKELEITKKIDKLNEDLCNCQVNVSSEPSSIKVRLELFDEIEQLDEVPSYFLYNIRPVVSFAIISILTMIVVVLPVFNDPNVADQSQRLYESYTEENDDYQELKPLKVYDKDVIGSIEIGSDEVHLYEKYYDNYTEVNYILAPYSTWAVFSETEFYYEIQEDLWVRKRDTEVFTPLLQEFIQNDITGIATFYTNDQEVYVYENANAESEKVGILADTIYQVVAFTENGWIQIDEDAWVKYDESIELQQQSLENKMTVGYKTALRTEKTTSSFIPVFAESNRESAVIGYLEDVSSVDIYEMPNSEWANIGTNAWIEAQKYMDIDWSFVPEGEGNPIGMLIVETDVLNVRQNDSIDSNLLGTLKKGREVGVYAISYGTGWYRIGTEGWVSPDPNYSTYIGLYNVWPTGEDVIGRGEITAEMINVRETDHSNGEKLGILNKGTIVNVYEISSETGWYRIGEDAWISNNANIVSYEGYEMEEY